MSLEQSPGVFVQRLSVWKTLGMELLLIAGAVLPLTPHFSEGLVYTAFFYRMPFFLVLVGACTMLGLMALVFSMFGWRAILRVPVLTITDKSITVLGRRTRTVAKSDVAGFVRLWPGGNVNLQIRGQPPLAIPAWLYDKPQATLNLLESFAPRADCSFASAR
jgi:hypothetical protein